MAKMQIIVTSIKTVDSDDVLKAVHGSFDHMAENTTIANIEVRDDTGRQVCNIPTCGESIKKSAADRRIEQIVKLSIDSRRELYDVLAGGCTNDDGKMSADEWVESRKRQSVE